MLMIRLLLNLPPMNYKSIEGQTTEVKGVGRRRTQLLDDMRNRIRYWELEEEEDDEKGRSGSL